MDGVVRAPSAFSMTLATLPSMMATQLLVVPRSMPMILAHGELLLMDEMCVGYAPAALAAD
jgi:hypothetical protein